MTGAGKFKVAKILWSCALLGHAKTAFLLPSNAPLFPNNFLLDVQVWLAPQYVHTMIKKSANPFLFWLSCPIFNFDLAFLNLEQMANVSKQAFSIEKYWSTVPWASSMQSALFKPIFFS